MLETVAESFASCLGGLLSIAAQNIYITFESMEGIKIDEILVSDYMLDKNIKNTIKLSQLLVGSKKDYIFSITADVKLLNNKKDENNQTCIIKSICNMESALGDKYTKFSELKVKLMPETAKNDLVKNIEVLQNFYRVSCAKMMDRA